MKNLSFLITAMAFLMPTAFMAQKGLQLGAKANLALSASAAYINKQQYVENENPVAETNVIEDDMIAEKLEGNVNTEYPEMGPIVSPDGKTLYFSRVQHPQNTGGVKDEEDIWYSEWNSQTNTWGEAKNMGAPLNNKYPNFINSVSPDGNALLLGNIYLPDGSMKSGVSLSHRTPEGWSFPKQLIVEGDVDTKQLGGFCLSRYQDVLLTSREQRKDSYGDLDLYVSFLKADSTWTKPLNLGPIINSKGTESAPFLSSDEKILYFTSEGFNGYGGTDIFASRRLDDTWQNWSMPQNLGPKVNTVNDESFFSISPSGDKIYFTSESNDEGNYDMFTLVKPEAPKAQHEELNPVAKENSAESTEVYGQSVTITSIYFDFEKSTPSSSSLDELYRISNVLSSANNMEIEISGHTDANGSSAYNEKLSLQRAELIAAYIRNKINSDNNRITIKGYGETKPAATNDTPEGRRMNRRVELKVTSHLVKG